MSDAKTAGIFTVLYVIVASILNMLLGSVGAVVSGFMEQATVSLTVGGVVTLFVTLFVVLVIEDYFDIRRKIKI